MDEEEIREHTRQVGEEFKKSYAMVAMPKPVVEELLIQLNQRGMDLDVANDGEDDAPVMLIVKPSSAVMDPYIAQKAKQFRYYVVIFLVAAFVTVLFAAYWSQHQAGYSLAAFLMTFYALMAISKHRDLDEMRKHQAHLKAHEL